MSNKMGRPPLEIDESLIEKLSQIHCTQQEIALVVGCSVDTLQRRFTEVMERGRAHGKASLRRAQWKLVEKGNASMAIWLGKNILGQKDKSEEEIRGEIERARHHGALSSEQLLELVRAARGAAPSVKASDS